VVIFNLLTQLSRVLSGRAGAGAFRRPGVRSTRATNVHSRNASCPAHYNFHIGCSFANI
jgi:hypothetical protein